MTGKTLITKGKLPPNWVCPNPRALAPEQEERAASIYSKMARISSRPEGAAGVAGLELQVALMLLESGTGRNGADNSFWDAKCQSLLVRPAVEPIACAYWQRFRCFDLDESTALIIASTLAGRRLVYRKGPATGRAAKGDVAFEPLPVASQWLAKIRAAASRPGLRAALPIYAFAQTIMAHPFSDGNGRFARLMVHAALARCAGLGRPEIALAPAFYRRADALAAALTELSGSGEWPSFNAVFLSVLDDALALTMALREAKIVGEK